MNSFICGSRVVIMVSTELLAFSATFARIDFPGMASFIHPKSPDEPLTGSSAVFSSRTSLAPAVVGLSNTAISRAEDAAASTCWFSLSNIGEIGSNIGTVEPCRK